MTFWNCRTSKFKKKQWKPKRPLSSEATLDEVAYHLVHTPGSPMTQRYAGFLASTQQNIADRSQSVMDEMLTTKKRRITQIWVVCSS